MLLAAGWRARRKRGVGRRVDLASFDQQRADRLRTLIGYFSEVFANSGRRAATLRGMIHTFIGSFMGWADANGHASVLDGEPTGRAAFRDYVAYLRECVLRNSLSINTGAAKQSCALDLLGGFLNIDDLHRGINLLRGYMQAKEPTRPPCEADQSRVLALCAALFEGFTALVLEGKPYPFRLGMPQYLDWADSALWIFPTHKWCSPPHQVAIRETLGKPYWAYDYSTAAWRALKSYCHVMAPAMREVRCFAPNGAWRLRTQIFSTVLAATGLWWRTTRSC